MLRKEGSFFTSYSVVKTLWFILGVALVFPAVLKGEEFSFQYRAGEKYKILSEVEEEVYVDGMFSHRADILNRIAVEVKDVREGAGLLEGSFITSEKSGGNGDTYELRQSYYSSFWRDSKGKYEIDPSFYMPVVRDVPVFPDGEVEEGRQWESEGEEVHDLRKGYGIPVPLRYPFRARYRYLGKGEYKGSEYDLISVQYTVRHRTSSYFQRFSLYPERISGFSDQLVYWDNEKGRPHAYNEQFSIVFSLSNGSEYEFTGVARAEIIETTPMDRERVAEEVERRIKEDGVRDALVRIEDRGVTINLEDIQFDPDSARLRDSEREKLERIAQILKRYPDRHLLVTGHTALAGTPGGRQQLSLDRANTVARFLLDLGVREPEQIMTEGKGAQEPVADNSTPEGMRKNRRVEITILEN